MRSIILVAMLFVAACGPTAEKTSGPSVPAVPQEPPIAEADARQFVNDFILAMNTRDNLALVKMTAPDGKFLLRTNQGDQLLDSVEFLKVFQGGLSMLDSYYGTIRSATYAAHPAGAVVVADIHEEYQYSGGSIANDAKVKFTLMRRADIDRIVCARMEGA